MHVRDEYEGVQGRFLLEVRRRGELVDVFEERNLIVTGSKAVHAHLLGGDVANRSVTQIGFGTGSAAADVSNTGLTAAYIKALDGVSYPSAGVVAFAFSLGSAENNGVAISEFGLFTGGSVLYARKVRALPLNKDTDLALSGTWSISF